MKWVEPCENANKRFNLEVKPLSIRRRNPQLKGWQPLNYISYFNQGFGINFNQKPFISESRNSNQRQGGK